MEANLLSLILANIRSWLINLLGRQNSNHVIKLLVLVSIDEYIIRFSFIHAKKILYYVFVDSEVVL